MTQSIFVLTFENSNNWFVWTIAFHSLQLFTASLYMYIEICNKDYIQLFLVCLKNSLTSLRQQHMFINGIHTQWMALLASAADVTYSKPDPANTSTSTRVLIQVKLTWREGAASTTVATYIIIQHQLSQYLARSETSILSFQIIDCCVISPIHALGRQSAARWRRDVKLNRWMRLYFVTPRSLMSCSLMRVCM